MDESIITSDDMPESYIVSREESERSFLDYSSSDEVNDSIYHVDNILLEEIEGEDADGKVSSPLAEI